jgi:hypothetical protein
LIIWLQTTQALAPVQERQGNLTPQAPKADMVPLIGLVATLIAEVLP